jgi:hypothetical protein
MDSHTRRLEGSNSGPKGQLHSRRELWRKLGEGTRAISAAVGLRHDGIGKWA